MTATFLAHPSAGIYQPKRVRIDVSTDGETFTTVSDLVGENPDGLYVPYGAPVGRDVRYIRYRATRTKEWLFTDEIQVY